MLYGPQVGVGAAPPKEGWVARALPGTGERRRVCSCSARAAGDEIPKLDLGYIRRDARWAYVKRAGARASAWCGWRRRRLPRAAHLAQCDARLVRISKGGACARALCVVPRQSAQLG